MMRLTFRQVGKHYYIFFIGKRRLGLIFFKLYLAVGIQIRTEDYMNFYFSVVATSYERRLELHNITLKTPYTKFQCSADEDKKEISFTIRGTVDETRF